MQILIVHKLGLRHMLSCPLRRLAITMDHIKRESSTNLRTTSNEGDKEARQLHQQQTALLKIIKKIPQKFKELTSEISLDEEIIVAAQRQSGMFVSQLVLEKKQLTEAMQIFSEMTENLRKMGRGSGMKSVKDIMIDWFEDLSEAISSYIIEFQKSDKDNSSQDHMACMMLITPDKLALLVLDTIVNEFLGGTSRKIPLVKVASKIGECIQTEKHTQKVFAAKQPNFPKWRKELAKRILATKQGIRGQKLTATTLKLLDESVWPTVTKMKLGVTLIQILIDTVKRGNDSSPVFNHFIEKQGHGKTIGYLEIDEETFNLFNPAEAGAILPRYLPMVVPPKKWNNKLGQGCYWITRTSLMRSHCGKQLRALRHANMDPVLDALDYLGSIPWIVNKRMLSIIKEAWSQNILLGALPDRKNQILPTEEEFITEWIKNTLRLESIHGIKDDESPQIITITEEKIEGGPLPADAADTKNKEKNVKKTTISSSSTTTTTNDNNAISQISQSSQIEKDDNIKVTISVKTKESIQRANGKIITIENRARGEYKKLIRKTEKLNNELHSLRCDMAIKLKVAQTFIDNTIYFPHSMDFRGRAYPVPPNLNHLGNDICRSLLIFAEKKPLGPNGLTWLKVHLANLFGNNKISHLDRAKWSEQHLEDIYDSAKNPLNGKRWWAEAEEPFQALSTCMEIVDAIDSGDPINFLSGLPVHQDGSCNGLQHYAALGRDYQGAQAVNLTPSDMPQDVYSKVLEVVLERIQEDCKNPEINTTLSADMELSVKKGRCARIVDGLINRKVVKQTVMTSVYGVTRTGARLQVSNKLTEKLLASPKIADIDDVDQLIFDCSLYVANLTLDSLRSMFSSAKAIMDWLATCAADLAFLGESVTWITPLGLPIIQPYTKPGTHQVKTMLQKITLTKDTDNLPVSGRKQQAALPPNFVHSLDSTHMLMTCLRMKALNKTFAAVHDSYWTHACDVDLLNTELREAFVELYEQPILEKFRDSLVRRYPEVDFAALPTRGTLDLNEVKKSKYFFH